MKLFLVGFMACGKSTIGSALAQEIDTSFIDLDKYIEQNENQSVSGLFESKGEQGFRQLELHYLGELCTTKESLVVATGGGAPCFYDNMDRMLNAGKVLYICVSPRTLAKRLALEKDNRPLVAQLNDTELLDFVSKKLSERSVYYEKANYTIVADDLSVDEVVLKINALLN